MQSVRGRFSNVLLTPFTAALAMLAVLSGVRAFVDPSSLVLREVLGDIAYAWAIVYLLGGLFMLYGMATLKTKFEASGDILFAGGTIVQAVVTMLHLGESPLITLWGVLSLSIFGFAAIIHSKHLIKGQRLIWFTDTHNDKPPKIDIDDELVS